jgi:hypothetical protein
MADQWLKTNSLLMLGVTCWLVALSPTPKLAKAIAYGMGIAALYRTVTESRKLIFEEARQSAFSLKLHCTHLTKNKTFTAPMVQLMMSQLTHQKLRKNW